MPKPPPSTPRATPAARGYGAAHRAERRKWKRTVDAGQATCTRCGQIIPPGSAWDLGHSDDRSTWTGPEHAKCNRSAGGRAGYQAMRERTQMIRRSWN